MAKPQVIHIYVSDFHINIECLRSLRFTARIKQKFWVSAQHCKNLSGATVRAGEMALLEKGFTTQAWKEEPTRWNERPTSESSLISSPRHTQ